MRQLLWVLAFIAAWVAISFIVPLLRKPPAPRSTPPSVPPKRVDKGPTFPPGRQQ